MQAADRIAAEQVEPAWKALWKIHSTKLITHSTVAQSARGSAVPYRKSVHKTVARLNGETCPESCQRRHLKPAIIAYKHPITQRRDAISRRRQIDLQRAKMLEKT
jgi:hypothetical protein